MATQKLQPTKALTIIPSDNANIPTPNLLKSGVTTDKGINKLIDSNVNFFEYVPSEAANSTNNFQYNVNVGDVVYNVLTNTAATIVEVIGQHELLLNDDIIPDAGYPYSIYQDGAQTGLGNQGAVLYVGGAGDLRVTTSGNDIVVFVGVSAGTFFPVNVVKLHASGTTCTNIIALW